MKILKFFKYWFAWGLFVLASFNLVAELIRYSQGDFNRFRAYEFWVLGSLLLTLWWLLIKRN